MSSRKLCSTCRRFKSHDEFHRNRHNRDGFNYKCKACRSRGYALESDEYRGRVRDLRADREGRERGPDREKKRCVICHRYLRVGAFHPSRVAPDGENECAECARISPWMREAIRRGRRELLDRLAVYDDDMPIAAGL